MRFECRFAWACYVATDEVECLGFLALGEAWTSCLGGDDVADRLEVDRDESTNAGSRDRRRCGLAVADARPGSSDLRVGVDVLSGHTADLETAPPVGVAPRDLPPNRLRELDVGEAEDGGRPACVSTTARMRRGSMSARCPGRCRAN